MEKILIVGVLLIGALGTVSSLRCYECTNCLASELKDEQLVTCGDTMTTTTVVTATDTTTATSGNPTTITPSIVGPGTTASTSTILDPGTTASTSTTLDPGTTASTSTILDPGTTASTSATAIPETTTSTNAPVNSGTTTPSESVNNGTTNSTNTITVDTKITTSSPQALRVRRDVQPVIVDLNSECTCFRGKCTCEEEAEFPRIFPYADATNITTYVCAKGTVKVNGTDVITRGCVKPKVNEQEICGYLVENLNVTACNTCTTDKCNSGFVMQHSIGIILVLTLVVFIK